jgi:acyl-CoA thioester hydrolase
MVEGEVAFGDCDPGGIMWHGHYWRWFEAARTALMRSVGLDVPELIALGVRVVIADARCSYHRPLRYGERFRVEAWVPLVGPAVDVHYRISRDGELIAKARTLLAAVHPHEDRLMDVPAEVLARLAPVVGER